MSGDERVRGKDMEGLLRDVDTGYGEYVGEEGELIWDLR